MALEHFVGDCLETVLSREERLDLPAALNTARHLVRALSALHAAGTLHGDLRPLNVLVSPDGEKVLIADLCSAACKLGKKLQVPVYVFLKEAIIRKYGEEFYNNLEAAAEQIENR